MCQLEVASVLPCYEHSCCCQPDDYGGQAGRLAQSRVFDVTQQLVLPAEASCQVIPQIPD